MSMCYAKGGTAFLLPLARLCNYLQKAITREINLKRRSLL